VEGAEVGCLDEVLRHLLVQRKHIGYQGRQMGGEVLVGPEAARTVSVASWKREASASSRRSGSMPEPECVLGDQPAGERVVGGDRGLTELRRRRG
jgi:hypothetical protein